ncbi:MAG: hypothetical protein HOE85_16950, partial [Nitrospinaceae bacterium]|nr:hypothetical protein [Nitrospinaceae bacterium]
MSEVHITGMGMVTALGSDLETAWSKALRGESGARAVSSFEAGRLPIAGAGEVSLEELAALKER